MLRNIHSNLGTKVAIALRNVSRFLNERDPHVNIDLDKNAARICQTDVQHKMLTTSWLNVEKLTQPNLARSDRMSNAHEVKMKRQIFIKMNMDLSLMFCLFGADLKSTFDESERTFVLEKDPSVKMFHIRSHRRIDDFLQ